MHTTTTEPTATRPPRSGATVLEAPDITATHRWEEAGEAWGRRATDWACLFEHYSSAVLTAIHQRLATGPGTDLLDVACGAGLAIRHAEDLGATVAGIDAAAALIDVARDRSATADLRVGSMFELPWPDASFDAVTSINGIWGGCTAALAEAHRVLRPGGLVAISFWGRGKPLDLRGCFKAFARHADPGHLTSMKHLNDIASPGVAEAMLTDAGFEVVERGQRTSTIEWPDADIAWRALASTGPAVPALERSDPELVRRDVLAAIEPCRDRTGTYRFRNDHQFVVAHKPVAHGPGAAAERPRPAEVDPR